jgi:hypothetical protein
VVALLASLALAGGAAVPAHAAQCRLGGDPIDDCTPDPGLLRGSRVLYPCFVQSDGTGVVVEGWAWVPFATNVTLRCAGWTPAGYVDVSTTAHGEVAALVREGSAESTPLVPSAVCASVSYTYADGTGWQDAECPPIKP